MGIASSSQIVLRASHTCFLFEAPENISREVLNQTPYKFSEWEGPLVFLCCLRDRQAWYRFLTFEGSVKGRR